MWAQSPPGFRVLDSHWERAAGTALEPSPGQAGGLATSPFQKGRLHPPSQATINLVALRDKPPAGWPLSPPGSRKELPAGLRPRLVRAEVVRLTCPGLLSQSPGGALAGEEAS